MVSAEIPIICENTVDGRNPAPVDVVDIPVFIGFYTSQVVQDFFHRQYVCIYVRIRLVVRHV